MSRVPVVKNDIMYDIIKYTKLCLNSWKYLAKPNQPKKSKTILTKALTSHSSQ